VSRYIDEHRGRFGVEPICRVLDVSASAYYQRATGARSERAVGDEKLLATIEATHAANYCAYGYRKMWLALCRAGETDVGRDRVKRLMRAHGIQGAKRRGKPWRTTIADPTAARSPDLVNRNFSADRPDTLWLADFTYLRCWEGVVFFSFVIDACSRRIVGWQFASHMRTDLVLDALRMALTRREHGADLELIHHSDAGSQYTSYAFGQVLNDHDVLGSIGSVGDAFDNAMAESFVDTFKTELISDRVWRTRTQLELAIVEWVAWFNDVRLHESLGDLPPAEFEQALSRPTDRVSPLRGSRR
jgi:putative transposase